MGRYRIALVFTILAIAPLISESLQVNGNSPKVSGYLFIFLHLVFMFVVSHVNLLHIHASTCPKILLMRFILSVVLERIVRFAATVDVVLEDYNSCLQNNK